MKSRLLLIAGALSILLITSLSCAGNGSATQTPITPDLTRQIESSQPGHYLWAYYEIHVDPEQDLIEVVPFRQVDNHWNVLKFLEQGPCTNCVRVLSMDETGHGTKIFDVRITHPFTLSNLTGFDVRGIAMFAGSHTFPVAGLTTPERTLGDGELVNADGYTTLYNAMTAGSGPGGYQGYIKGRFTRSMTPNALLNGYKRHVSVDTANTRNAFYAGTAIDAEYELDMPDGGFVFGYAVDASWAPPTAKPVEDPMVDFPPEANCPEPWRIEFTEETISQGLTDEGGETKLYIDVYDHQGRSSHFPPVVECPELFDGSLNAIFLEDGTGYARFEVTVENEKIAPMGEYKCLISVIDTENATAPDWLDLTAYKVITLTVADYIIPSNQPPVAAAHADNYNPQTNQNVNFIDDSTDPDGEDDITKWEWDFSFDPVDGFQIGSQEQNPSIQYSQPGIYKVQLRVTDSALHTDLLDDPLEITVSGTGNYPPTACADADNPTPSVGDWVHFYDCSNDPDGYTDIVQFEWDMDEGGASYGDKFGPSPMYRYMEGGDYLVQHRVTDTAFNQDDLDEPLLIEVNGPPIAQAEADVQSIVMGEFVTITNTSYDDDGNGEIEEVYWDINGNGEYDDPEDIQDDDEIELSFFEGGIHEIGLKVVDEWGLEAELDPPIEIIVEPFQTFCVRLIDQYNSADGLYGVRSFDYYNEHISGLDGLDYSDPNGPWDFRFVPPSAPAVCSWLLPSDPEVPSAAKTQWPDADFFFKEDAPSMGQNMYVPHRFDFSDAENGDLMMQGQYHAGTIYEYGETFPITHPICHPWFDAGGGSATIGGVGFDVSWDMQTLGTGPAIFIVNGNLTVLNCILIRHHITFTDTDSGWLTFHLLNYQWIDEEGNEVAFMEASNGLEGTNFSGNAYTGTTICRSLKSIS